MEAEPEGGLRRGAGSMGTEAHVGEREMERKRQRDTKRASEREKQRQKEIDRQAGDRERWAHIEKGEKSCFNNAEWMDGVKGWVHLKGKATTDLVGGQILPQACHFPGASASF